ncbi:uncharacterized protein LOC121270621 [Carcharodon carcharias]|uniref:uncharacterized protein LOC121270621 n=1 Tax=Carcharodon carcharias TaxID=13397 RepID=UPI001B7E8D2C|nr:uncharacterized protein LOC121270621 [Carcharodon carcharias]
MGREGRLCGGYREREREGLQKEVAGKFREQGRRGAMLAGEGEVLLVGREGAKRNGSSKIYFLMLLLLVDQLRCAEGERLRPGWRRREIQHRPHKPSSESVAIAYLSKRDHTLSGKEGCRDEVDSPRDFSSLSLSPWKYRICTDPNRYPPTIRMAECLRKDCILPGTESPSNVRSRLVSIPLSYTLDVWYRRHGLITRGSLTVPIGCTCVRERHLGRG